MRCLGSGQALGARGTTPRRDCMSQPWQEGLRVVVLADAPLRAWVARAAYLLSCDPLCAEATVLVVRPPRPRRPVARALLDAYRWLDRLVLVGGAGALAAAPNGEPKLVTLEHCPDDDSLRVRLDELAPQLLILLGSHSATAPVLEDLSGAEIWALRHGSVPAGRPDALLREFVRSGTPCVTRLVQRDRNGRESLLYASRSGLRRRLSLHLSLEPIARKSAAFPVRALQLRRIQRVQPGIAVFAPPPAETADSRARDIALLPVALASRAVGYLVTRYFRRPTWSIAWQDQPAPNGASSNFAPSGALTPPPDRFYADPFLAHGDDGQYVFYEDFRRDLGRAAISVFRLDADPAEHGQEVLAAPHHLSYPFVFRVNGVHYMLPESAQAGVVTLLRAQRFPYEWRPEATLLSEVRAYDPTVLLHEGRWFLFVALAAEGSSLDELHLFWSDDLRGPYHPHPLNPIVSDVCRARPAGRIIRNGEHLLRPGQDGSGGYGSAVVLSEILRLGPTEYEETPVARISPAHRDVQGVHTIDRDGAIEVMDLLWLDRRFASRLAGRLSEPRLKTLVTQRPAAVGE
jgi:hypothetical protein